MVIFDYSTSLREVTVCCFGTSEGALFSVSMGYRFQPHGNHRTTTVSARGAFTLNTMVDMSLSGGGLQEETSRFSACSTAGVISNQVYISDHVVEVPCTAAVKVRVSSKSRFDCGCSRNPPSGIEHSFCRHDLNCLNRCIHQQQTI